VITTKVVEDPETCLTWAYEVFAPGDRKFARHWAKDACKVIGSLRVAQLLFSQLSHRLPTGAALREASRLATADLESKYDVLSYTLEKYLQKESPYAATIIAVDQVKTIAPTALACLKREFEENKKAMYFALKACR
jgi:hypothetical protein